MLAFLSGWRLYVVGAIVLAVLAAGGYIAYLREQHKADVAQLALDKKNTELLTDALKQSEADKALMEQKAKELDAAIQERDKRLKALNDAKRNLADELDRIKKSVSPEDKTCLDRSVPDGILELLRGADHHLQDGNPEDTGEPAPAVPQV